MLSVSTVDSNAAPDPRLLASVGAVSLSASGARHIRVPLEALGPDPRFECWSGGGPAVEVSVPALHLAHDGCFLFGRLEIAEADLADCAAAAERAYAALGALLREQGYPHLLRSWNYIHDIHRGSGDQERYRQFCLGRYRAVSAADGFEQNLPAATVIGTARPGMQICFLAGKVPGVQVENPRQTPAFRYPRDYGPASPSFSRGTLLRDEGLLLMSGTASVVGHATRHPHDVEAQCGEIFTNIGALLERAAELAGSESGWAPQLLRVFLRQATDLDRIRPRVEAEFGAAAPVLWLRGDICRTDLAMEIDGVFAAR